MDRATKLETQIKAIANLVAVLEGEGPQYAGLVNDLSDLQDQLAQEWSLSLGETPA
jgi:hypothetical protein